MLRNPLETLSAIELCIDLGLQDTILKGDAGLVVRAINDKNPKWCHRGQILEDIKRISVGFRRHED